MAAEAINNRFRCPTCDGSGPDYTGMAQRRRCEQKYGNARDGIQSSCVSSLTGTDFRPFADADMMTPDGGQILVMPKTVSRAYVDPATRQTITVHTLEVDPNLKEDPHGDRQLFWLAAWDHCFLIAGPRPTPRYGAGMKTPSGKTQRAMFNHCAASQNALVKQCTDLLAYYTRPNCTDTGSLCEKQKLLCSSVEGIMDVERFGKCEEGLSPYEEQLIMQSLCKTNIHYIDQRAAGATDKDLSASSDLCEISWSSWRAYVAQKHDNYTAAANGMQKLKACWASVESLGRGSASFAPNSNADAALAAIDPANKAPISGYFVPAKARGRAASSVGAL